MLETASKSIHNWWRYPSSNCCKTDENVVLNLHQNETTLKLWLLSVSGPKLKLFGQPLSTS